MYKFQRRIILHRSAIAQRKPIWQLLQHFFFSMSPKIFFVKISTVHDLMLKIKMLQTFTQTGRFQSKTQLYWSMRNAICPCADLLQERMNKNKNSLVCIFFVCLIRFWLNDKDYLSVNTYYLLVFNQFLFHGFPALALISKFCFTGL